MMINKKTKRKYDLALTIILVLGIVVMVNFFAFRIFHRWDLTENKMYSISDTTKKVVKELDDVVQVKLYFSSDLPHEYTLLKQNVLDILDEYTNYSSNFKYQIINPIEDVDAYRLEIPKLQFNVLKKDKLEVVNGYLGMVIEYGKEQEVIPMVQDVSTLEYQITNIVKKMTSGEMLSLGFVQGHGPVDASKDMSVIYEELSKVYELSAVDLNQEIDEKIKTLAIVNSQLAFNEEELKRIDAFVMKGGSLLIAQDGILVSDMQAKANQSNLNDLLEKYGIRINNNLILDTSNGIASFSQGFFNISLNYPFWPKVLAENFDQDNPAVAKLDNLVFPWISSIDIDEEKIDENSKVSYLVRTTSSAWEMNKDFVLDPNQINLLEQNEKQYNLAVGLSGKINSAYSDNSTEDGKIVVISDSEFVLDSFLQSYPYNKIFFQNLVDYLSLDEDLISIRSKNVVSHPIAEIDDVKRQFLRYGNVFGITVLVVLFGVVRYAVRRKTNNINLEDF